MSTRLYPQIDASLLNDRYAQYKKQALKELDNDSVEDALEEKEEDFEEEEPSESESYSQRKETLFDEYESDEDADYESKDVLEDDGSVAEDLFEDLVEDLVEDEDVDVPSLYENTLRLVLIGLYRCKQQWKRICAVVVSFLILFLTFYLLSSTSSTSQIINIKSLGDISKSIQNLQWQINDLNSKNKNKFHDLRNYLDLKIDEVTGKFAQIDSKLDHLQKENYDLLDKLEALKIDGVDIPDGKIPVMLDSHNNVQLLPEFKEYLQRFIQSSLQGQQVQKQFQLNYEQFAQDYINEIVNDKIGFMKRDEILHLITLQFQENKKKLIQEIKTFINKPSPQQDTIPQKLIPKQDHTTRAKINYAQSSNGARIINYLSSPTFQQKTKSGWFPWAKTIPSNDDNEPTDMAPTSPFIVLTSNQGFWKSGELDATLGIKFLEPIYINEFKYQHARVLNSAMLTACPKSYEVYIHTDDTAKIHGFQQTHCATLQTLDRNSQYYRLMECEYDVNGDEEQSCLIPDFMKTLLVKSLVFKVNGNYGNEFFTAINKLQIHGLTRFDLAAVDKLLSNDDIGEPLKRAFRVPVKKLGGDAAL